jgi:hypothetical protein
MQIQETDTSQELLFIGVISSGGSVVWVGAAASRAELAHEVADYLLPHSVYQLRDAAHAQFRRLLSQGQVERAVDLYFATVGERWDVERLSVFRRRIAGRAGDTSEGGEKGSRGILVAE